MNQMYHRKSETQPPARPQLHDYAPWMNVVCGLAIFLLRYAAPRPSFSVHWNLFLIGMAIVFASVAAEIAHGTSARFFWSAFNVAAGAWLLVSARTIPSIIPVTHAQEWLGALVVVFAIATALTESLRQRQMQQRV
jgi:hypothetical protein